MLRTPISTLRPTLSVVACLGALAVIASCSQGTPGSMVSIPPPDGWEENLLEQRERKDQYFKTEKGSPLLASDVPAFERLDYWEPDPAYYHVGQVRLYLQPEKFDIVTTGGVIRPCEKVGWVAFTQNGQELKLQVYRLLDQQAQAGGAGFFLPFMDATTGEETYHAGRYIDLLGPEGGPYVLDFNNASNPWCAYGDVERYVCPVTPPENRLPIPIEAGERGYRKTAEPTRG